jgi:hypothetical protein
MSMLPQSGLSSNGETLCQAPTSLFWIASREISRVSCSYTFYFTWGASRLQSPVMALPSSPPLLPESFNTTSPPLLPVDSELLPLRPSITGGSRKRQYSDYENFSSDPVFSEGASEGEDEGIGEGPRRKRLVRGPWWCLRRNMAKRDRWRTADSGVWLGSDLSDESMDSTFSSQQELAKLEVTEKSAYASASSAPPPSSPLDPAQTLAAEEIARCLDSGREVVDLSNIRLTTLPDSILRPLHHLIRPIHDDLMQPPSEDEFGPLTPSIQLFLSGNKLTSLPRELFSLDNITVLSLRNNTLTTLPPAIGQLKNLKELNIAQNSIRYLPWEMMDLIHCQGPHRQITTRPNPLLDPIPDFTGAAPLPRPRFTPSEFREHLSRWGETNGAFFEKMKQWYSEDGEEWTMQHELQLKRKLGRLREINYQQEASRAGVDIQNQHQCNEQLIYLASSAIRFFEVDGSPMRNLKSVAESEEFQYQAVFDPEMNAPPAAECLTALPSLFELALRSIQSNYNIQDHSSYPDTLPVSISNALQHAAKSTQYGNEACSVCGKQFIIARAEWMEFWFNGFPSQEALMPETILPFLRKACSWVCAKPSELGTFRF